MRSLFSFPLPPLKLKGRTKVSFIRILALLRADFLIHKVGGGGEYMYISIHVGIWKEGREREREEEEEEQEEGMDGPVSE